LPPSCDGCL